MLENNNKTEKGILKQEHIMRVALALFEKYGYEKISVDRIVKESKTSKGSFYQHFPSKSSIFTMRFIEMDKSYIEIYNEIKEQYQTAIERLEVFCIATYEKVEKELGKELMRVIYSAAIIDETPTFFTGEKRKLYEILWEIIEDGKKDNSLEIIDEEEMFQIIVQNLMGGIYFWGIQADNRTLAEIGNPLLKQMVKGFKKWKILMTIGRTSG